MDKSVTAKAPSEMPRPIIKSPEEMDRMMQDLEKEGYDRKRFGVIAESVGDRKILAEKLHKIDPSVNGNVNNLIEDLALYQQEIDRKEGWFKKALKFPGRMMKKTWEGVSSFAKKHPIITTVASLTVIAATIAATLYTMGYIDAAQVAAATETVKSYLRLSNDVNIIPGPEMENFSNIVGTPLRKG